MLLNLEDDPNGQCFLSLPIFWSTLSHSQNSKGSGFLHTFEIPKKDLSPPFWLGALTFFDRALDLSAVHSHFSFYFNLKNVADSRGRPLFFRRERFRKLGDGSRPKFGGNSFLRDPVRETKCVGIHSIWEHPEYAGKILSSCWKRFSTFVIFLANCSFLLWENTMREQQQKTASGKVA